MNEKIPVSENELWVKIVGMLQQNWALIVPEDAGFKILFVSDTGDIFDSICFSSVADAEAALLRNKFEKFRESPDLQSFICAPTPPFIEGSHPNGRIYSSGRFWR